MKKCRVCKVELVVDVNWGKYLKEARNHICDLCRTAHNREYYKEWKKRYPEKHNEYNVKRRERAVEYRKNNREMLRAKQRELYRRNPGRGKAKTVLSRLKKRGAVPDNITREDKDFMIMIYEICTDLTNRTGLPHIVHHVKAIKDGGLHMPDNLVIMLNSEHLDLHRID